MTASKRAKRLPRVLRIVRARLRSERGLLRRTVRERVHGGQLQALGVVRDRFPDGPARGEDALPRIVQGGLREAHPDRSDAGFVDRAAARRLDGAQVRHVGGHRGSETNSAGGGGAGEEPSRVVL